MIKINFFYSDESSSSLCEEIVEKMSIEVASSSIQISIMMVPPSTPVIPKRKSRKRKSKKCNIKIITS